MTTVRARTFRLKVAVGDTAKVREEAMARIAKQLHIANEDDARELRHACVSLHKINPRGGWCMQPAREPILRADRDQMAGQRLHAYLKHALETLYDGLPTTAQIRVEVLTPGGGNPAHGHGAWIRFLSDPNTEIAAIDTASFATHIRAATVPVEQDFREANLLRLKVWARQLDAQEQEMPQILHALGLFATTVRVNHIVLRGDAA
ncbi:MAG: hypothetical protein ACYC9L_06130 [Sulfuricaulis sp.]